MNIKSPLLEYVQLIASHSDDSPIQGFLEVFKDQMRIFLIERFFIFSLNFSKMNSYLSSHNETRLVPVGLNLIARTYASL